ncbi:MAG: ABC transporter permease [Treponema sp.]|nr:ABC transporter permease [Treponema sp.]
MENIQGSLEKECWTKVITARHRLLDLHLRDVYRYRDLIVMFIKRDFVVQYKQTILGPLWYLIQPIMSSIVYIFVFGRLANIGTDGVPPMMFYFGGTMLWTYFTSCLTGASNVFISNQNIFSKVYFPRLTVPISTTAGHVIKLLIQSVLLAVFYVYYMLHGEAVRPTWWLFAFPLIVLWIGTLGTSVGLIVSSLTTKYRDLVHLLTFGIQLSMYATPVVYPLSEAPQKFFWVFYANPMSAPMELFRVWAYGAGSVPLNMLLVSLGVTAACAFFGLMLFVKNERSFVDVI